MNIAVIGTGYVGLVAGTCFAESGNRVLCVDRDGEKIALLRKGGVPIYEPGVEGLIERNQAQGRLQFTTDLGEAVRTSSVLFLAVGTPSHEDGSSNLTYLQEAVEEIGRHMDGYRILVNKSTVPVGAHARVSQWLKASTPHPFDVASNPEFLKEGSAVDDFLKPDRVVIGTDHLQVFKTLEDLYRPFVRQGNPIVHMDPVSAELCKYACNAFLAMRISFMNELSALCEGVGADVEKIRRGMTSDTRIGKHFLYPGIGYGGSCFPKDIRALLHTAEQYQTPMKLVIATEDRNQIQKKILVDKIRHHFQGALEGKTFALWGLSFKPNTDDLREAPSLDLIRNLVQSGCRVHVSDPVSMESAKATLEDRVTFFQDGYEAAKGCHGLLIATEWNEFRYPDFGKLRLNLKEPVIFDGRNLYEPDRMRDLGFAYYSIGRKPVLPTESPSRHTVLDQSANLT